MPSTQSQGRHRAGWWQETMVSLKWVRTPYNFRQPCARKSRCYLWIFSSSLNCVIFLKYSGWKVLFNRSGEKDRLARMSGLMPVLQQWHKKKVFSRAWQKVWKIQLQLFPAWLRNVFPLLLLAWFVLYCGDSVLHGDLLPLQTGALEAKGGGRGGHFQANFFLMVIFNIGISTIIITFTNDNSIVNARSTEIASTSTIAGM